MTRTFTRTYWKLLLLGLLVSACGPARSSDLSRVGEVQSAQVSGKTGTPDVNDCALVQAGKYSCNGKTYSAQQLATLRAAAAAKAASSAVTP